MTTEVINIQIREDGSRVVARNIENIGKAAEQTTGPLEQLKGLLLTVVSTATIALLARYADQWTNVQNRLRLVTEDTANLARVTKELKGIANETRSDFVATAELYSRLASSTKDLGLGQQELLSFTKSLNQAIVLSGASAEEAAGGIRQLAQGIASGTLRGDELNSVLENFPRAADVIAESLGVTRGELRKLGADGKVTAEQIVNAFLEAGQQLDNEFATTVPTISQSFTVLRNNVIAFIGELNEKYKITEQLSKLIIAVASNLDTIIPILGAVAAAIAAAFVPGLIASFIAKVQSLWALLLANPFVAVAAAVVGVVTALTIFRDQIKLGIDETTTLGDLMRSIWESIGPVIEGVATYIGQFFSWISGQSADAYNNMIGHTEAYGEKNEAVWLKVVRVVLQVFDMIGGVVRGVMAGVYNYIKVTIDQSLLAFEALGDGVQAALNLDFEASERAREQYLAVVESGNAKIASSFGEAFAAEQLSQASNGLEAWFNERIARAQEIGKERLAGLTAPEGGLTRGSGRSPNRGPTEEQVREMERLANALRNVLDQANPVQAAQRQLAEAQFILNDAVKAGLITQEQSADAYARLADLMREQLDPLSALNEAIDTNIKFLQMGNEERDIEMELYRNMEDLRRSGVVLTQAETEALRAKLIVERELTRIAQTRSELESGSQGSRQRDLQALMTAIKEARADPNSGVTQGDAFNALNNSVGGLLGGSQEALQARLAEQQLYYEQIQMMRENDLINEETYQAARLQIWANTQALQLQTASDFFGQLTQLSKSENKKLAAVGKAAAIAQTIINTYQSATAAYASMASIPFVGPVLGAAAAGAAIAAGLANVSAIRSQTTGFRTGGNLTVGGNGGTDSQLVAFRATPGERVQVNTPAQARALERAAEEEAGGSRVVNMNMTVVQQGRPDRKTPEQTARAMLKQGRKIQEF